MSAVLSTPQEQAYCELEQVLSYHDGDAIAAIETLLDDCRHLRQELTLAESVMSPGMARGWRPSYERPTNVGKP